MISKRRNALSSNRRKFWLVNYKIAFLGTFSRYFWEYSVVVVRYFYKINAFKLTNLTRILFQQLISRFLLSTTLETALWSTYLRFWFRWHRNLAGRCQMIRECVPLVAFWINSWTLDECCSDTRGSFRFFIIIRRLLRLQFCLRWSTISFDIEIFGRWSGLLCVSVTSSDPLILVPKTSDAQTKQNEEMYMTTMCLLKATVIAHRWINYFL